MTGLPPHSNPHKVALKAFREHPQLLDGRVSNKLFVDLLKFYERGLEGSTLSVTIESALSSLYVADLNGLRIADGTTDVMRPDVVR